MLAGNWIEADLFLAGRTGAPDRAQKLACIDSDFREKPSAVHRAQPLSIRLPGKAQSEHLAGKKFTNALHWSYFFRLCLYVRDIMPATSKRPYGAKQIALPPKRPRITAIYAAPFPIHRPGFRGGRGRVRISIPQNGTDGGEAYPNQVPVESFFIAPISRDPEVKNKE